MRQPSVAPGVPRREDPGPEGEAWPCLHPRVALRGLGSIPSCLLRWTTAGAGWGGGAVVARRPIPLLGNENVG